MKKIKLFLLLALTLAVSTDIFGQELPTPFNCDAAGMIITEGYTSGEYAGTTRFSRLSTGDVPMLFEYMFSIPYVINSTGYNPLDNFLYAFPQSNTSNLSGQNVMYRIGSNGAVEEIPVTPMAAAANRPAGGGYKGGTIDTDGIYYLSTSTAGSALYYIDLKEDITTSGAYTTRRVTFSGTNNLPDIVWDPVLENKIYGIDSYNGGTASTQHEGKIVVFTFSRDANGYPTGLSFTRVGARWSSVSGNYSNANTYSFGGAYMGQLGILYGSLNAGGFYQFDLTTGTRAKLADSAGANANDGAFCPLAYIQFASDLAITKDDGRDYVVRGGSTTYTVVVSNLGPYPANNAMVTDALPDGIPAGNMTWTAVASDGSSTSVTGIQTGAINDMVTLPVDGTVTYSVTVNIPLDYPNSTLVNTAAVTPHPQSTADHDMTNNEATDTNEVRYVSFVPVNPNVRVHLK